MESGNLILCIHGGRDGKLSSLRDYIMSKRKHPNDREERLRINKEKEARKSKTVKAVSPGSSSTVSDDE
jgi:hypothetical protein